MHLHLSWNESDKLHNNKSEYAEQCLISHSSTRHNNLSAHKRTSQTSNSDYLKRHTTYLLGLGKPLENKPQLSTIMLSSTETQSNAASKRKLLL